MKKIDFVGIVKIDFCPSRLPWPIPPTVPRAATTMHRAAVPASRMRPMAAVSSAAIPERPTGLPSGTGEGRTSREEDKYISFGTKGKMFHLKKSGENQYIKNTLCQHVLG